MLSLSQIDHSELCHGWTWVVQDKEALARCVAIIALGHYRHVYKILDAENITSPNIGADRAAAAIKFLSVLPGTDPWHRDGWIFQAISWIAALKQADKAVDVIRAPHIIKADKGFDGLQLKVSNDGLSVEAIVVFEDKATDNPRKTIHEEVWAGIDELESGGRSPEITHGASALLEANQRKFPEMDVDLAISNILWKKNRIQSLHYYWRYTLK